MKTAAAPHRIWSAAADEVSRWTSILEFEIDHGGLARPHLRLPERRLGEIDPLLASEPELRHPQLVVARRQAREPEAEEDAEAEEDPAVAAEKRAAKQAWLQYARALFSAAEFRYID